VEDHNSSSLTPTLSHASRRSGRASTPSSSEAARDLLPFGAEDARFIDYLIDEAVRAWLAKNSQG
jgi:hypothetical protein